MVKPRLIPVLLLQNGLLVRSERFAVHQIIGNPIHEVERLNQWNVDELIYLDITREGTYDIRSGDAKVKGLDDTRAYLEAVGRTCLIPLTRVARVRRPQVVVDRRDSRDDQ